MTLREAREARELTQAELAAKSGIDQSHISKIERGETADPKNSTVRALEAALRLRPGRLVFAAQLEVAS